MNSSQTSPEVVKRSITIHISAMLDMLNLCKITKHQKIIEKLKQSIDYQICIRFS